MNKNASGSCSEDPEETEFMCVKIEIANQRAEFNDFYQFASQLESKLGILFIEKTHDFDELYWLFYYKHSRLVLSYGTFDGISIYPAAGKDADDNDIQILDELKALLKGKSLI